MPLDCHARCARPTWRASTRPVAGPVAGAIKPAAQQGVWAERKNGKNVNVCDGHHRFFAGALLRVPLYRQPGAAPKVRCGQGEVMIKARDGMLVLLLSMMATAAAAKDELRGTPEQRAACMGDALTLCADAIPNRARIASCLGSKMSQLSPRCRAQFEKGGR